MKPSRQGFPVERNPDWLHVMVGQAAVAREAIALVLILLPVEVIGLVDRPLRGTPVDGGDEVALPGRDQFARCLGRARPLLLEWGRVSEVRGWMWIFVH